MTRTYDECSGGVCSGTENGYDGDWNLVSDLTAELDVRWDDSDLDATFSININGIGAFVGDAYGEFRGDLDPQTVGSVLGDSGGQLTFQNTGTAGIYLFQLIIGSDAFCASMQIVAPTQDELVLADNEYTVRWTSVGVDSVHLSLSLDSLNSAPTLFGRVAADSAKYAFYVPDTLSRKAFIIIQDASGAARPDTSDMFRVKGYELTRLDDDDEYEAFVPRKHGWSFGNIEGLLSPPAYANATQFFYNTGGSDPFTGDLYDEDLFATRPNNYAEPTRFDDWPSFVRAFGMDDTYWGLEWYRRAAVRRWLHEVSDEEWGGSCSGMTISALMAFVEKDQFGALYPQIGVVDELNSVVTTFMPDHVRETINELFSYWSGEKQRDHFEVYHSDGPRTTLEELKERLLDESESHADLTWLFISNLNSPVLAHAVAPIKLIRTSEIPNQWELSIYDPNHHGVVRTIKIDSTANQWSYAPRYDGSGRFFVMDPISNYFPDAVYPRPTGSFMSPVPASKRQTSADKIKVYPSAWANVEIASEAGSIGYADSAVFNTLADAHPSIKPTGYPSSPEWYRLPGGTYGITMSNFAGDESVLSTERAGRHLTYARYDASSDQTDHIVYDGGLGTVNHDDESKTIFLDWIAEYNAQERLVEIDNFVLKEGDSVYVDAEGDEAFRLENFGSDGTYDLILTRGRADTVVVFGSTGIPISAGARHRIPPNWNGLGNGPVEIQIDADGDGTYEGTMQVISNVAVEDLGIRSDELPTRFDLKQNYPNPFNPSTTIAYSVPQESDVTITVFDALGRTVESLGTRHRAPGTYTVTWDAGNRPSGVYFYRLETDDVVLTRSMMLTR